MGIEDIDRLHELDLLCFPEERAFTTGYFLLLFLYHRAFGWGLEKEGLIEAFVLLTTHRQSGNISTLDVHPRYRRHGIGSRLMMLAEMALKEMGMKKCTLQVAASNTEAIRLYDKLGYKRVRILHRYYAGKEDGYLMEKGLTEEC